MGTQAWGDEGWGERGGPVRRVPLADAAGDLRPPGWTEARALAFIADLGAGSHPEAFAIAFSEGAWDVVKDGWPAFDDFVRRHADPA